jgi:hypothetical protein
MILTESRLFCVKFTNRNSSLEHTSGPRYNDYMKNPRLPVQFHQGGQAGERKPSIKLAGKLAGIFYFGRI